MSTACRWLHGEGFWYISHKKGLYIDGHNHLIVLAYRQNDFLPRMKSLEPVLVCYSVGDVEKEIPLSNFVECHLMLCSHDDSTSQTNDLPSKAWVLGDEHHLQKKGVGCRLHQSDVISLTVGWLADASQTLEYGKNYDGYGTGNFFVKQV